MARIHHDMPDDFNPAEDVCLPLVVPKDGDWIGVMVDLLHDPILTRYWRPEQTRLEQDMVDAYFDRVLAPFVEAVVTQQYCADETSELGSCYRMGTETEAFTYYPNDPFTGEVFAERIQSGTKLARWRDVEREAHPIWEAIEDFIGVISGYRDNDVMVTIDPEFWLKDIIQSVSDFFGFFSKFQLPYALVEFEGGGQLEVELLNVPYGGAAILVPDFDNSLEALLDLVIDVLDGGTLPQAWLLVELDRDVFSTVPELVATQVQEFEFEAGEHTMHIVFIPTFNPEPPFLRFFGGIREIEACGNIQIKGSQTGALYDEVRAADDTSIRKGAIGIMTTQEVCDGVKCAVIDLMEATLLGLNAGNVRGGVNVTLNEAGEYEVQLSSSVRQAIDTAPQVLPEANIWGAAIAAQTDIDTAMDFIVDGHANSVAEADVVQLLELSFALVDGKAATAVSAIYAKLTAVESVFTDYSTVHDKFNCFGLNRLSLVGYIYENAAVAELPSALAFAAMFEPEQFSIWTERGLTNPKEGYQDSTCYRIPDQFFTITPDLTRSDTGADIFDGNAGTYPIYNLFLDSPARTQTWSYLLYASGHLEHTNGDILQLWHKRQTLIWSVNDVRLGDGGGFAAVEELPLKSQNPYYAEYHVLATDQAQGIRWTVPNWNKADMTGQIVLTLVDNGAV